MASRWTATADTPRRSPGYEAYPGERAMLCAARALLSGAEVTSAAALPICSADGIPAQAVARGGLHGFARVGSVSMWGMESTHCVGPIPPAHGGVRIGPGRSP